MENYLQNIGASNEVIDWFDKRVKDPCDLTEQEHIADFFLSSDCPKRFERMTYKEAKAATDKWVKKLNKQAKDIKESEDDIEVVKEWKKDGFKFVKLIGKNAYKREGVLMRHCSSSYFGKDDELYSLRDKKNNPHCTISKRSQQIKGKGNGHIHPKYIKYVVEFLEFLDIDVRDSEMKNLGYVNIEDVKDNNAIFPKEYIFRKKYFYKNNLDKIVDKEGNRYENLTLWGVFGLFEFTSNLKIKFNFSVTKSVENFKKLFKGRSKDVHVGGNSAKMSGGNSAKMSGGDSAQMSGGNSAQMSGGYFAKMSGGYSVQMSGGDFAQMSGGDFAKMSGGYSSQMSGCDSAQMSGGDSAQMSGGDSAQMSGGNSAKIELRGKNAIAMAGKDSQMRGVIGAWIVLTEYDDDDNNIINVKASKIDGDKLKENTWYKLENNKFVTVAR